MELALGAALCDETVSWFGNVFVICLSDKIGELTETDDDSNIIVVSLGTAALLDLLVEISSVKSLL